MLEIFSPSEMVRSWYANKTLTMLWNEFLAVITGSSANGCMSDSNNGNGSSGGGTRSNGGSNSSSSS